MIYFYFSLFILISLFLATFHPKIFVIYYIFISTKMLGWLSIDELLLINGLAVGIYTLNIIALTVGLFQRNKSKISNNIIIFIFTFITLFIYGIIYPYLTNSSSLILCLIASKEFWTLGFLIYLLKNKVYIDGELILKSILFIGTYFSLLFIIYLFFNVGPIFYIESKNFFYIRVYYPTYISLSIFILYYFKQTGKNIPINSIFLNALLFIGIFLSGHFSLFLTTIFFYFFFLVYDRKRGRYKYDLVLISSIAILLFLIIGIAYQNEFNEIKTYIYEDISGSLSSREKYNEFRFDAIDKNPYMGYGFLHQKAELSKYLIPDSDNKYMEKLEVIDSGYVDILIKFGFLGGIFYLLSWFIIALQPLKKKYQYNILTVALASYLIQYFVLNFTWSVFTYSHGLIPGFLSIVLIDKNLKLKDKY